MDHASKINYRNLVTESVYFAERERVTEAIRILDDARALLLPFVKAKAKGEITIHV